MKRLILGLMLSTTVATGTLVANTGSAERYTFARPPAPESALDASRLRLSIETWASDADRDRLRKYVEAEGTANLARAFPTTPDVGRVSWPGGLEYGVRYARKTPRPDGGSDVVLVLDRPLWVWWDDKNKTGAAATDGVPAVIVQLQLDAKGRGEGRISYGGVGARSDARLGVALADYSRAPALLMDLRMESRQSA
jgi:hypothetical protein